MDISTTQPLDIYSGKMFQTDAQSDWVLIPEESTISCEDVGKCNFDVAFVRNLNTLDVEEDIAFTDGEERLYAFKGFYAANDIAKGHLTHAGQSNEFYILMGAQSMMSSTLLALAAAFTLASFWEKLPK